MKTVMNWMIGVLLIAVVLFAGCSQSLQTNYNPGLETSVAAFPRDATVGIAKFEDVRPQVAMSKDPSKAFVAEMDMWKYGLTYNFRRYIPINDLVQDILIRELKAVGIEAKRIGDDRVVSDISQLKALSATSDSDYVLGGQIMNFEFNYIEGMFKITGSQTVALSLNMLDSKGVPLMKKEVFMETNRENEGMVVTHGTSVDKLLNRVLKKVLNRVIAEMCLATTEE